MPLARITVHGLVQGVGFRYFTQKRAIALDLRGFVRNERNGDVYVEAVGSKESIEDLIRQLEKGPAFSRVAAADVEWDSTEKTYTDFTITG